MWQPFKEYFNFTKKERHGIFYIVSIIFILIILPFLFPFFTKEERIDFSEFEKEIAQLKIDSSSKKTYSRNDEEYYNDFTPSHKKYETSQPVELFYFDPNTATVTDWINLGVKPRTAEAIQKYISKGGKFHKAEDIKKIWGLSEKDAERLIPYVSIKNIQKNFSSSDQNQTTEKTFPKKDFIQKVDINIADTSEYISLPGIGSKLSKRIIAFREKLGGFYSVEQVAETYLLPDSTFQKIKPYLIIDNKAIKKININVASVDEMKSHPYVKYQIANAIFQFRQQHGNFNSVEEIKKIMAVTDEVYNKASPYLTVE
ncbi:MAG TPA: helix-hairpin-helix domain-containing protein [Hanamia sp.]|nr:helix-hairpin-helix domain-containing protein [Hanamia sp.]